VVRAKRMAILTVEIFIEGHELYRLFPVFNATVIKTIFFICVLTVEVLNNVTMMHFRVTIVAVEKQ
jgi:hypothetical protein